MTLCYLLKEPYWSSLCLSETDLHAAPPIVFRVPANNEREIFMNRVVESRAALPKFMSVVFGFTHEHKTRG